jgi:hypothetical protein
MTSYGAIATTPAGVVQASTEEIPWGIDMTPALPVGGSVTGVSSSLLDQTNGKSVTMADSPSVAGNIVTQIVRAGVLTANHTYLLTITYTAATSTVLSTVTTITCPV